ncbi:MAG: hypothetical protein JWP53_3100, partial [Conexibacter sp.]|nr:hypothetical protein [Conexibacter sp.]
MHKRSPDTNLLEATISVAAH